MMFLTLIGSALALKISLDDELEKFAVEEGQGEDARRIELHDPLNRRGQFVGGDCGSRPPNFQASCCMQKDPFTNCNNDRTCQVVQAQFGRQLCTSLNIISPPVKPGSTCSSLAPNFRLSCCNRKDPFQCDRDSSCEQTAGFIGRRDGCYPIGCVQRTPRCGYFGSSGPFADAAGTQMSGMQGIMSGIEGMIPGMMQGMTTDCSSLVSLLTCNMQDTCVWNHNTKECAMETAHPCTILKTENDCDKFHSFCYFSTNANACMGFITRSPKKSMDVGKIPFIPMNAG